MGETWDAFANQPDIRWDRIRAARPISVELDTIVQQLVKEVVMVCDCHLEPGNDSPDNCPGCQLWGLMTDIISLSARMGQTIDEVLEHGPPPNQETSHARDR